MKMGTMYIIKMENLISCFKNRLGNKTGFGLVSALIAIFIVSVSALSVVQMSVVFMERWIMFQTLSTEETLRRNFEQAVGSPTNVLASIIEKDKKGNPTGVMPENRKLKKCLTTGRCSAMNDYIGFTLYDISKGSKGRVISSGEGERYDIFGEECSSQAEGVGKQMKKKLDEVYCPFAVKSKIKAFCWGDKCEATGGNTGFAIEYEIRLKQKNQEEKKIKNFVYLRRSHLKNAAKTIGCCDNCKTPHYYGSRNYETAWHVRWVKNNLKVKCVQNRVKETIIPIILPY